MEKLTKAPLQEVIFEIRWLLEPDINGRQLLDPKYQFALGIFKDAVKENFPHHVARFPQEIPHQMLNYQTVHQFWHSEDQWPVVQLGPGIATVNDNEKNYEWEETYLPNIQYTLDALVKSYGQMVFNFISLRYIDVVRVADYGFTEWKDFVQKHIKFRFENHFDTRGELTALNFEQTFKLNDNSHLNVSFNSGKNNKKEDIFIWQTAVSKQGTFEAADIVPWLHIAHECTSDLFKEICKDKFYASFSK